MGKLRGREREAEHRVIIMFFRVERLKNIKKNIYMCVYVYITESLCCTAEINTTL